MHAKFSKNECPKFDDEKEFLSKIPYQFVVGSIMYAMITTRPNIAFAMGVISILWLILPQKVLGDIDTSLVHEILIKVSYTYVRIIYTNLEYAQNICDTKLAISYLFTSKFLMSIR